MWRLSRSKGAHAYACEILRFATCFALQGKKSGRCSHLGSDHELGTEVQKGRVYTHPKQADLSERYESQDGLVEWEQGNWAEAYVSWRRTHNLVISMWTSTVCGNATEANSQAEIPILQHVNCKSRQADDTLRPFEANQPSQKSQNSFQELLSHCHRQQTKKVANSFRSFTELSARTSRRLWVRRRMCRIFVGYTRK